ncbi:hypothetical protein [Microcoleus asticus]|uniref:Uncharacterized protein n=1 Tax=Microcoleus asticus IPMA8 TaxID=2563858 RepID=A0ABX2CXR0_9CYAN|nr:hypothetical protein [Microcoleus asticus]NQE35201.1 hypothetical protein [Microcoleus asticus IPMA8]
MTDKFWGVTVENSALAFSIEGLQPGKWLQNAASQVWGAIKKGVQTVVEFGKKIFEGGKELLAAIGRGDWALFGQWLKDDPLGFLAGGAAVAVAGWFIGSATGLTALASGGVASMWGALGSIRLGGVAIGAMLPTLQQAIVGTTNTIINVDWLQSDNAILAELKSVHSSFMNTFGETVGRTLIGMFLGGGKSNPKLKINITGAAAISIQAEQDTGNSITEEIIDELSNLANAFIRYARNLAFKIGYMNLRKLARENIKTGIKPIDDKIANWGLQDGQTFVINQKVDDKLEKITETNPDLGNFLEGLKEGALDGFNEFVVMT